MRHFLIRLLLPATLAVVLAPTVQADDELIDRIWSSAAATFVDEQHLREAIVAADIVLLGEIHDQPRHHELQAKMLQWSAEGDRRAGLIFEMIGPQQQDALDDWQFADDPDPSELGPALAWEERGWPDWSIYQPIAAAALAVDARLHAGAPDRDLFQEVVHNGLDALSDPQRAELGLDRDLPEADRDRLVARLEAAHCELGDHLPIDRMVAAQRLRDASLAHALLAAYAAGEQAVVIAGNEHVRRDYGIPHYIDAQHGDVTVVAIGLIPAAGLKRTPDGAPDHAHRDAYDFTWYTPGAMERSPCHEEA